MCDTNPIKLGFVVAEFNRDITYMMEIEGREHAAFLGAEVTECIYVPGAYDMPLAIKKMLTHGKVDAVITIGCVIEGSTQHDEIVVQHAARKIIDLSLEFGKPVTLGISGPGMTRLEANERIDYAKRAVESAIKLVQTVEMKPLSTKIAAVTESATIAISNKAKAMQRQGIDVISLSIGEPDFDTPQHITDACIAALKKGETHYAPSNGIPELTGAIAEKITKENKFPCTPQQVIVACGAKDAIYEACEAVLNPGDETIILTPAWVSYEPCVQIAGGNSVFHGINEKTFQLDDTLLEKVTSKTKMIIVNSPSNPTGAVFNKKSMKLVADLCEDKDLYAMSDEIYEKMIYGKEHLSLAAIGDMHHRTITINGFSKAYAMTGWRLGYAVAPRKIIAEMSKVQQHSISQVTTFAMFGGVAALKGDQSCVEAMRQEFDKRRQYVIHELRAMGYETAPAEGAFYAFVRVTGDDMEVASRWLDKGHVAATPGSAFYAPGWVRLSYAASMEKLKEAMARIRRVG